MENNSLTQILHKMWGQMVMSKFLSSSCATAEHLNSMIKKVLFIVGQAGWNPPALFFSFLCSHRCRVGRRVGQSSRPRKPRSSTCQVVRAPRSSGPPTAGCALTSAAACPTSRAWSPWTSSARAAPTSSGRCSGSPRAFARGSAATRGTCSQSCTCCKPPPRATERLASRRADQNKRKPRLPLARSWQQNELISEITSSLNLRFVQDSAGGSAIPLYLCCRKSLKRKQSCYSAMFLGSVRTCHKAC